MSQLDISKLEHLVEVNEENKQIWTEALQRAIDENDEIFVPNGKYYIDRSLILKSNTTLTLQENAEICLLKGVKTVLLRNADVIDGSWKNVDLTAQHTENIKISGGIFSEENDKRLGYGKSGAYDEENSMVGVSACMLFSGVKNLSVQNVTFRNTAAFALQIGRAEDFVIENVKFENCYADGVHVNGYVKNGIIKNVYGETGDDLVALNMYDWENSTINNGPLENVTVEGVFPSESKGYKAFRIQPGIVPPEKGEEIDCYVKGLRIKNVRGISVFKLYLQTPAYKEKPDGAQVGRIEDISFEDVEITLNAPVDQMENYRNCNPVTGHFGAFEIGSNIKNITMKGVKATLNTRDYATCHLITVGPKSSYRADLGMEIFDPYVCCEVESLTFSNVMVNGEEVTDMSEYVHETAFENLYPTCYGNGQGKIKLIKKN